MCNHLFSYKSGLFCDFLLRIAKVHQSRRPVAAYKRLFWIVSKIVIDSSREYKDPVE